MLKVAIPLVVAGGLALSAQDVNARRLIQAKVMSEYKGVKLGMKRDAVKVAMGNPSNSNDSSDDFNLTGDDTMTVHYENGEVRAIQIAFLNSKSVPTWKDVVGDAEVNELPNGNKSARRTVEAEKFWVSIYQTKDGTLTRITISRQ
jgi:hypothetical protein